jgi:hypothetical protein
MEHTDFSKKKEISYQELYYHKPNFSWKDCRLSQPSFFHSLTGNSSYLAGASWEGLVDKLALTSINISIIADDTKFPC